jgi:nucleoside-diphosphate-sugar epimerase
MCHVVTGGAGFRWGQLPRILVEQGRKGFRLLRIDLSRSDPAGLLDGGDADLHLAGQPGVRTWWGTDFRDYGGYVGHDDEATQRLHEETVPADQRGFVYASSSSVCRRARRDLRRGLTTQVEPVLHAGRGSA